MKLLPRQYGKVLYEVTKNVKGSALDKLVEQFFLMLLRDRMLSKVNYIIDEFIEYSKEMSGVKKIEITSARVLNKNEIKKICRHFGDKVESETVVDKTLLGGVKVKSKNTIMDASLKNQLNKLKTQLT